MTDKNQEELYSRLYEKITSLYDSTRESQLAAHWKTGKYLAEAVDRSPEDAGYGKSYIERLAQDLSERYGKGFSETTLKNMRRFFRYFPIRQPVAELEMSKYLLLATIKDEDARYKFTQQALEDGLSRFDLKRLIENYRLTKDGKKHLKTEDDFKVERGSLYRYKRIQPGVMGNEKVVTVDCGFNVRRNIPFENVAQVKEGDLFKTEKRGGKYYISEIIENSTAEKKKFFTYKALVERVIDGDTIWLNIDTGFDTMIRQKIRLRGIDTPEMIFAEGRKAKDFVQRQLRESSSVIIKTYKTDKYDRYIADLFYLKEESSLDLICTEGKLLNSEIVARGYGRKV